MSTSEATNPIAYDSVKYVAENWPKNWIKISFSSYNQDTQTDSSGPAASSNFDIVEKYFEGLRG